jgi:hypothetical protein
VGDWPELLSEVRDLEAPDDVTPYVMARINAAQRAPESGRGRGGSGRRLRSSSPAFRWLAAAVGCVLVLCVLAVAAHSRRDTASPLATSTPVTVVNPEKTVVHTRIVGGTVGLRWAIRQALAGIGDTTITSVAITAAGSRYRPVPPDGVVLHFSYPYSKKLGPSDILAAWQSEMVAQAARDSAIERALTPVVYFTTPTAGGGRIYAKQVLPQSGHIPSPSYVSERVDRAARGLGATVHSVTILRPRGLAVQVDLTVTNPQAFLRHDWDSFTHRAFPNPPLFRSSVIDGWFVRIQSHGVTYSAQSNTDRGPYARASWRNPHLPH